MHSMKRTCSDPTIVVKEVSRVDCDEPNGKRYETLCQYKRKEQEYGRGDVELLDIGRVQRTRGLVCRRHFSGWGPKRVEESSSLVEQLEQRLS